jgi:hypothetical protein
MRPWCLWCLLGDGNFVQAVLENCQQELERRYRFQARGYDFDWLVGQVASLLNLDYGVVTRRGRYPNTVEARSVLCYWAARELGISTLELSRKLGISQPTASQSAKRGERIVKEKRLKLMGWLIPIYQYPYFVQVVQDRSPLYYRAGNELGMSKQEIANRLGLRQPAVSIATRWGKKMARQKEHFRLGK